MPAKTRAELIGGRVYMPSPLKDGHGGVHASVMGWLWTYASRTRGTKLVDNATCILGEDSEPQPDASLTIEGGRTRVSKDGYLSGAPELIVEIALSSESYDLFDKRDDYEKYGVGEYLVLLVRESRAVWFVREEGRFVEMPDQGGVLRSRLFPGLWLEVKSIFVDNKGALLEVLNQGITTPEHATFVERLGQTTKG